MRKQPARHCHDVQATQPMIRLDLSPLAAVVLGSALVMLALLSAWLAAWWVSRRFRRNASPSTTTAPSPDASLDADWMRSQVQALQRSQAQLHDKLDRQFASLAHVNDYLSHAPPRPLAPAANTRNEAPPNSMASTAAPPSAPRPAQAGVLAAAPAQRSAPISVRPPTPDAAPTPLPRAEPRVEAAEPEVELSDEEIDALPPELPAAVKQRKRILAPPKKPTLQNL